MIHLQKELLIIIKRNLKVVKIKKASHKLLKKLVSKYKKDLNKLN